MTTTPAPSPTPGLSGTTSDPAVLAASFDHCREIARREARNFFYGMKLTPEPKRSSLYAIYAWMRAADDLADAPEVSVAGSSEPPGLHETRAQRIEAFRCQTFAGAEVPPGPGPSGDSGGIWPAMHKTLRDYPIPRQCLEDMIAGQLLDQRKTRYATFAELHDYCYKVAGTVGLVCISVWGYRGGQATQDLAVKRGVALQLTNILRDLVEDARRDRLYLPGEDLARFTCGDDFIGRIRAGLPDGAFDRLMRFQIERAAEFYKASAALEESLDPAGRPASWAIMRIYRALFERIARDPRRVLRERVRLSPWQKGVIALRATLRCGVSS